VFTGVFLVVVLAAMMSTTDSLLILASSAVVRDVLQKVVRPDLPHRRSRGSAKRRRSCSARGRSSWRSARCASSSGSCCSPGRGWPARSRRSCSARCSGRRTTRAGALAGMVAGFVTTVAWVLFFKSGFYELYEMIPGFLAGLACTVGVSLVTEPPAGAAEEHDAVWTIAASPPAAAPPDRGRTAARGARPARPGPRRAATRGA
jgi:sodium/proline symporter